MFRESKTRKVRYFLCLFGLNKKVLQWYLQTPQDTMFCQNTSKTKEQFDPRYSTNVLLNLVKLVEFSQRNPNK